MPAVKTYTRVNFQNYPSTSTPLNATNLNKMDKGIDDLDDEVVTVKNAIENMSFDADSISYDNTSSGLQATDVQDAVDEINDNLTELEERIELMNFESFNSILIQPNSTESVEINLNKKTYISICNAQYNNPSLSTYKVENGVISKISGTSTVFDNALALNNDILICTNPNSGSIPIVYTVAN